MDRVRNPFNPGAGSRPPLLVGRDPQIEAVSFAVQRLALGRFERSVMLTGLRGVGKTVLLNEFGKIAESHDWIHAHMEATEDVRIAPAIAGICRRALLELSFKDRSRDRARRALGVLRSFIKVHVPFGDAGTLVIEIPEHPGPADTGQLDSDLAGILVELGAAARSNDTGVLITIDEIQYLARRELSALIVALHRVSQVGAPILVVGAGLPSIPGLAGEARSYAERLFSYVTIGPLNKADATRALVEPVVGEGARWDSDAVALAFEKTEGYPYFLQEFGKQVWNLADEDVIDIDDMKAAVDLAVDDLDSGFFRARIDKTSDAERDYLRAMVSLGGPGPYRSGEVSRAMGKTTTQNGPVRDSLIKRGLCYAPRHGELAFTVPMFDEYIRRTLT